MLILHRLIFLYHFRISESACIQVVMSKKQFFCLICNINQRAVSRDVSNFPQHLVPFFKPWMDRSPSSQFVCKSTYEVLRKAVNDNSPLVCLPSLIPKSGKGLFALKSFKKGEDVTFYGGTKVERKYIDRLNLNKSHFIGLDRDYVIDGTIGATEGMASRMNSVRHLPIKPNVTRKQRSLDLDPIPSFFAKVDIMIGDELYWDYPIEFSHDNTPNQLKLANLRRREEAQKRKDPPLKKKK
jgi:hypothetical protein